MLVHFHAGIQAIPWLVKVASGSEPREILWCDIFAVSLYVETVVLRQLATSSSPRSVLYSNCSTYRALTSAVWNRNVNIILVN